jgi:cytoskeleton protein RodZ
MPRQAPRRSRTPVLVSLALLLSLGLALAAVTLALRPGRDDGVPRPAERRSHAGSTVPYTAEPGVPAPVVESRPPAPPPAPAPRTTLVPKASPPAVVTPRAAVSTSRAFTAAKGKSYRLVARASQSTWIRVRLDGVRTVEETLPAGAVREWISSRPFELRIANAGGLTLELNGRVLPPLGAQGTTVHRLVLPTDPR